MPNLRTYLRASRQINATAAGVTVLTGAALDMQGFDGVLFVAAIGTLTATQVTFLGAQDSPDGTTWGAVGTAAAPTNLLTTLPSGGIGGVLTGVQAAVNIVTAAMADADSNKLLVLDVFRPLQRFVRAVLYRGTANAVLDGLVALQYGAKKEPTTMDSSTVSQTFFGVANN